MSCTARLVGDGRDDNSLDVLLPLRQMNASTSFRRNDTAMRSCDSEMASSVPSRPSYFFGTAFRSMSRPSASSPMATDTPPAPKSLQRRIMRVTLPSRNRR